MRSKIFRIFTVAITSLSLCVASFALGWNLSKDTETDAARISNTPNLFNDTYSLYDNYYVYLIADGKPLFTPDGHNGDVAIELYRVISEAGHNDRTTYIEQTADHMSQWVLRYFNVPEELWATDYDSALAGTEDGVPIIIDDSPRRKSGGVFIRLFDAAGQTGAVREIAEQWFQVVYTTNVDDGTPIITFYMADHYGERTRFHTSTPNPGYSGSALRGMINADYAALATAFPELDSRTVYPSALPGLWQSQEFQTGDNDATIGRSLHNNEVSPLTFFTQNGMNANGRTATGDYLNDKMWLPSAFETLHMGVNNEIFGELLSGHIRGSIDYANLSDPIFLRGWHRTGLWRLNGFDRVISSPEPTMNYAAWLRSGSSGSNNDAAVIHYLGGHWVNNVSTGSNYVRPALHLSFTEDLIETYTVDFVTNGGTPVASISEVPFNVGIARPVDPIQIGKSLVAWYSDEELETVWNFSTDTVTENMTLYAKWFDEDNLTVTFNSSGGTPINATQEILYNDTIVKPSDPIKVGMNFVAWYADEALNKVWNFPAYRITESTTLYARWTEAENLIVTFDTNGGIPVAMFGEVQLHGTASKPADPIKVGYSFVGWYGDEALTQAWDFTIDTISTNITLYAKWAEASSLVVTFNSNGGSAIPAISNVAFNGTINKPIDPIKVGMNFAAWYADEELNKVWDFATDRVTENTTLYAKWTEAEKLVVSFNTNGGSEIDPLQTLLHDTLNNDLVPTKKGFTFGGWFTDSDFTTAWDLEEDTVTEDLTLYAKWIEIEKNNRFASTPFIIGAVVGSVILVGGVAAVLFIALKKNKKEENVAVAESN
jgi:uncharacterized repeat protein (TIGR02543 family)